MLDETMSAEILLYKNHLDRYTSHKQTLLEYKVEISMQYEDDGVLMTNMANIRQVNGHEQQWVEDK
jgi:hypothetical protein